MIKMDITDAQIDEIAAQINRARKHSKQRTVYDPEYGRKGVCGEVALREFFDINEWPRGVLPGGDDGIDVVVKLLDRDNHLPRPHTVDVKCAVNPTYLWVEDGKAKADVYVLAQYSQKTRRATCIKWHWGMIVRASPVTFYGKHHHEIAAGRCLEMDELEARFRFKRCWCGADANFGFRVDLRADKPGQWLCYEHWRTNNFGPTNQTDQFSMF